MNHTTPSYFDYAATCPLLPEVAQAMQRWQLDNYANPGSQHRMGQQAQQAVEAAQHMLCTALTLSPSTTRLLFTSGATEALNTLWLGLFGLPQAPLAPATLGQAEPPHVITTAIEHDANLQPLRYLEEAGLLTLTVLPVTPHGQVCLQALADAWRPTTRLLSVMWLNNETGHRLNVTELAAFARQRGALVHSDMAQAFGKTPLWPQPDELTCVDYITLSAHKVYGPKGIGALVLPKPTSPWPVALLRGGSQQQGQRAGTLPVGLMVGLAKAMNLAYTEHTERYAALHRHHEAFRQALTEALPAEAPLTWLSPPPTTPPQHNGSAAIAALALPPLTGEQWVTRLSLQGFCVASGSACHSGQLNPSHVLLGMGYGAVLGQQLVRVSFSHLTPPEGPALLAQVMASLWQ
jgi:cysteine desulfurase